MLRRESSNIDASGQPVHTRIEEHGGKAAGAAFVLVQKWIENMLDIYKPELKRLLWPLFVHSYLNLISDFYPRDGEDFFKNFKNLFEAEHKDDLRSLTGLNLPEHVQDNDIAKLYRTHKYRLSLSNMAFSTLIQFLETKADEGGRLILNLLSTHLNIHAVDRAAAGGARGLQKLLAQRNGEEDLPAEDEGIPGHNPGSANTTTTTATTLHKLSLGPLPMETDLAEDVKAELAQEDASHPPPAGQSSLVEQFEQNIKVEPNENVPSRDQLPFPPSTAKDVAMEVQKIKENRDRFRIEGRTGGVGPGVSVTMFTLHNTFDSVSCIEFSGDNMLVAAGTAESYIRVWSLDNQPLVSPTDPVGQQPSNSRRLIGHSGPVYALSFSPSIALPGTTVNGHANSISSYTSFPKYLLSSSADSTIRLWSLDTWTNLVVYKSHSSPVWDVRFCPHGHYFVSSSADRTARLWSTSQIAPLRLFVGHDSDVETVAWHPNGAYIFTGTGGGDKTVRMWSIITGSDVRIFTGHVDTITALACAPNGTTLASADDRGEIILWDLPSGRLIKRMRGHARGGIWSLDWSIESSVLVSGGADGTVRVWDVAPNKETGSKTGNDNGVAGATKTDGTATISGTVTAGAGGAVGSLVTSGSTTAVGTSATGTGTKSGKGKKDVAVSPDQISAFPTKKSAVYKVRFTQMNLVVAGGAYLP
nr:transcription initiation factor tfiid subunit 5 [Quercus suber]